MLVLVYRAISMLPVFRDELQRYLGIGDGAYGLLFSIGTAAGLIAVLAGGVLVDRRGPVTVLRLSATGIAMSFLLIAVAGRRWLLMAGAVGLCGMCSRPLSVAMSAYLVRLFPGQKRRALSLSLLTVSGGELVFPALAEGLLALCRRAKTVSFGAVLHTSFAVAAALLFLGNALFPRPPELDDGARRPAPWRWRDLWFGGSTLALILLGSLHGIADSLLFIWMPRFLGSEAFAAQPIPPGLFISGFAVAYVLSRTALALLPDDRWRRALMVLPGILGGSSVIVGILTRSYLITGFSYVVGGLLWAIEFPVFLARIADEAKHRFGAAMALQQMVTAALAALGLGLMGAQIEAVGEPRMWRVMLCPAALFPCVGIGAGLWLVCNRHRRP